MEFPEDDELVQRTTAAQSGWPTEIPMNLEIIWEIHRNEPEKAFEFVNSRDPEERRQAFITMYDSWASAHPGETPDYDALPEEARSLWRDLSRFGPLNSHLKALHEGRQEQRGGRR